MSAQEASSTMAALPTEEDRFTMKFVYLERRRMRHLLYLPARTNKQDVHFIVDTGSDESVVSENFVRPKQIRPCALKEICYVGGAIRIIGQASLALRLTNGESSMEIAYQLYVTEGLQESLLAMDFLTDFRCVLDMDAETISLSRTPRERRAHYPSPSLALQMSASSGRQFRRTALVDTGAFTYIPLKAAQAEKLRLDQPVRKGKRRYRVTDELKVSFGSAATRVL